MEPPSLLSEPLRDGVDERGDIVVRLAFDLGDALGRGSDGALRIAGNRVARHDPDLGPAFERGQLDVEPAPELRPIRPDQGHGRAGVAGDHRDILESAPDRPSVRRDRKRTR